MIVFLDSSLVAGLEETSEDRGKILNALSVCAQQAREGRHLLLADRKTFLGLESFYPEMDSRTVAALRRSSEKLTVRKQIRDFVTRAVRLVSDAIATSPIRRSNGTRVEILLPVSSVDTSSSLLAKPLLMVENINDGLAYAKLVKSIADDRVLTGLGWLSRIPLHYEIAPGGGDTLANLFSYHKDQGERLGIAIVDGDYRYHGSPVGATARKLLTCARKAPKSALLEPIVLGVRTIENCLPRAEIARLVEEIDPIQVQNYNLIQTLLSSSPHWGVVPIKKGVKCFELGQSSDESEFWSRILGARICNQANACTTKQQCVTYALPPVSDQLLRRAADSERLFMVTPACRQGVEDTWRELLNCFYSLFCGSERIAVN